MVSLFSLTSHQIHYDKPLVTHHQIESSRTNSCSVERFLPKMDQVPPNKYSFIHSYCFSSSSSSSSSPSSPSFSLSPSRNRDTARTLQQCTKTLHKALGSSDSECHESCQSQSNVSLDTTQNKAFQSSVLSTPRCFFPFQFSDKNGSSHSRSSSSSKTFQKRMEEAVACSHISSNFRQIVNSSKVSCLHARMSCDSPHPLKQENSNEGSRSTSSHCRTDLTPVHYMSPTPNPCSVMGQTAKRMPSSQGAFHSEECNALPYSTPLVGTSLFSSSSDSLCDMSPDEQAKCDEKEPQLWSPFEDFSDLHSFCDYPCSSTQGSLDCLKDRTLSNNLPTVTDNIPSGMCAICLSDILEQALIGEIVECHHKFCFECIITWANRTNYCPLCKQKFNSISQQKWSLEMPRRIVDITLIVVEDKILHVPEEENGNLELAQRSLEDYICQVCRDGSQEEVLLLCDGCDEAYHTFCVGRTDIPEGPWFCHACSSLATQSVNSSRRRSHQSHASTRQMSCPPSNDSQPNYFFRRASQRRCVSRQAQTVSQRPCTRQHLAAMSAVFQENDSLRRPITRSFSQRVQEARNALTSLERADTPVTEPQRTRETRRSARRLTLLESPAQQKRSDLEQRIRQRWSLHTTPSATSSSHSTSLPRPSSSSSGLIIPSPRRQLRDHLLNEVAKFSVQENSQMTNSDIDNPRCLRPEEASSSSFSRGRSTVMRSPASRSSSQRYEMGSTCAVPDSSGDPTSHVSIPLRKRKALIKTLDESVLSNPPYELTASGDSSCHTRSEPSHTREPLSLEPQPIEKLNQPNSALSNKNKQTKRRPAHRFDLRKRSKRKKTFIDDKSYSDFDSSET